MSTSGETIMPSNKCILIVMESHMLGGYVRRPLEETGFKVQFHGYPKEFLRHLAETPNDFDAVIMDVYQRHGPELDETETDGGIFTGVALYKRLNAQRPEVPVILFEEQQLDEPKLYKRPGLRILNKLDMEPTKIPHIIEELLSLARNRVR